jgi:hypothetical protein
MTRTEANTSEDRAPAPWREPPDPVSVLRAAGVSPAALAGARRSDLSRSHELTLVALSDGRQFVVKRVSRSAHAAHRSLAAELYAYRLASWRPGLASVVPASVHLDERRQVVALEAAPTSSLLSAQCLRPGFPSPALAEAMGRALAALHVDSTGMPLVTAANCGVVHLPDTPEEDRRVGDGGPVMTDLVRRIVGDAVLAPALRAGAAALRPSCLVHADLKWDNAILDEGPPARVLLFDWELSGRGDPAWDVGSALADTLSLRARIHGLGDLDASPSRWLGASMCAVLRGYASGGSPHASAPHPASDPSFAERVRLCWVGRTVQLALECAAGAGTADDPAVSDLLAIARGVATASGLAVTIRDALEEAAPAPGIPA